MTSNPKAKILDQWWQTRLAHQAVMLQDAQKVLAQDRAGTQAHLEGAHDRPLENGTDDVIHIGDQITNHPAAKGMSRFGAAGIALAAAAMPTALAAYLALKEPSATPAPAPNSTTINTNKGFLLELIPPKK